MSGRKLEDRLEAVRGLRTAAPDAAAAEVIRKCLRDRSNLVVAEAAKTAAALRLTSLIPDMLAAFDRLFDEPIKTDPKCWGKTAIVKALTAVDYDRSPPFLRGLRHIQMEPVWGGQEDAAPQLRATCFLALVQCTDVPRVQIMRHLVDAMVDPADAVRVEAVRALAQLGGDDSTLLLRLKARQGDARPLIVGHCFDALIGLDGELGVQFVCEYLETANAETRDEAALALGASRRPDAIKLLMASYERARGPDHKSVLLRALSSSHDPVAIDFLFGILKGGDSRDSALALEALSLHESSEEIASRIKEAKRSSRR